MPVDIVAMGWGQKRATHVLSCQFGTKKLSRKLGRVVQSCQDVIQKRGSGEGAWLRQGSKVCAEMHEIVV